MYAYVGSRTTRERNARGLGISVFRVCPQDGGLDMVEVVVDLVNPSYLTLGRRGSRLYAAHGDRAEVSCFAVEHASGRLTLLNRQDTGGRNPVFLALDPDEQHLVLSNHGDSNVAVLPIGADGSLGPVRQVVELSGVPGPHRIEQQYPKPHANPFTPSGHHVIVPDKGLDRIFSFRFADGQLSPAEPSHFVQTREGAGPRHVAFHPTRGLAYVVNELDSTVTTYRLDPGTAELEPLQIVPTLPDTFTRNNRSAAIEINRAGSALYISNRGHDSIATLHIDPSTGLLRFVKTEPTLGRTPRAFARSPDEKFLYALNEDSDSIVVFQVRGVSGELEATGDVVRTGSPVCMVFAP